MEQSLIECLTIINFIFSLPKFCQKNTRLFCVLYSYHVAVIMTKSLGALRPCAELGGSLGQGGQWPAGVLQGCPGLPVGMTDQGAQEGGPWARLVGFTRKGKSQAQGQGRENPKKPAGSSPAKPLPRGVQGRPARTPAEGEPELRYCTVFFLKFNFVLQPAGGCRASRPVLKTRTCKSKNCSAQPGTCKS
jgi:hypothetical protein